MFFGSWFMLVWDALIELAFRSSGGWRQLVAGRKEFLHQGNYHL